MAAKRYTTLRYVTLQINTSHFFHISFCPQSVGEYEHAAGFAARRRCLYVLVCGRLPLQPSSQSYCSVYVYDCTQCQFVAVCTPAGTETT